jgi:hypothetical protein
MSFAFHIDFSLSTIVIIALVLLGAVAVAKNT